jgi:GT2 family glycosyltransferase
MISRNLDKKFTVYGVVVSHNPDKNLFDHLNNLVSQVSKIYLFDNNSSERCLPFVKQCESISNIIVIYSKSNIGLSKAQNKMIRKSLDEGADWILTLDDDSNISDEFIAGMLKVYNKSHLNVGAVVPLVKDLNSNQVSKFLLSGKKFKRVSSECSSLEVLVAISSGMLIKSEVFHKIGFMNEDYFIDYIDIDFSLRLNSHYSLITSPDSILFHRLGSKQTITIFSFPIIITNHSPFRRYHIYRNRIDVWKRYFSSFPMYILYELFVSIVEAFKIIFFEKNKKDNFLAIFKGVKASFKRLE